MAIVQFTCAGWHDHGVDLVDHAIGALDVGLEDLGTVDGHSAILDHDLGRVAFDRLDFFAVQLEHIGGQRLARDHVVLQDRGQLLLVLRLEQAIQRPLGEFGERFIRRDQDRERPFTLERVLQAAALTAATKVLNFRYQPPCRRRPFCRRPPPESPWR